jgi:hypothetical protein
MHQGPIEPVAAGVRLDRPEPDRKSARLADTPPGFTVFVDTEEEFDWSAPRVRDPAPVDAIQALPAAQSFFRARGVIPTYVIDYPVAATPASAAVLRGFVEAGDAIVGAHLHPWVNPPHDEAVTTPNSFAGNLPIALERAKLATLTDAIERAVGTRPSVYRAGRYGVGPYSAALLEEAGYRMDASIRTHFDYRDEEGPDFTGADLDLFWAGPSASLLAFPLSTAFTGALRGFGRTLFPLSARVPMMRGALSRLHLLRRVPLTPEGTPLGEAIDAIGALLDDGVRQFSLSFHSPSIEPGHTPYVRDAADLRRFYAWWDGVFDAFAARGVSPTTPDALVAAAWRERLADGQGARPEACHRAPASANAEAAHRGL